MKYWYKLQHGRILVTLREVKEASQKDTYSMIPLLWNIQNRQIYRQKADKWFLRAGVDQEFRRWQLRNVRFLSGIIKILENNVCSQLSIQEIADMCNISVSLVNKIFARYSSGGIHKYFLKLKIIKAIELLSDGIEISQISERLAFNNQNYFSLVFKRETGLSPLNYKKKHFLK